MLQKLRSNKEGFTLIELMIVIAIIGILAAIAIPNFIEYRNKSYCSRAESDANTIAATLADYFAIPSHTTLPTGDPTVATNLNAKISSGNSATVGGTVDAITITVTDGSGRCPQKYRDAMVYDLSTFKDGWNGLNYVKYMMGN